MKFAVLSLNPGIDRVLYLPTALNADGMNRITRSVTSQGSKGANVSILLRRLGCDVTYYSFTGGYYGKISDSFTEREKIPSVMVDSACGVRLNTKVIDADGVCTELNERGGPFSAAEAEELVEKFSTAEADVVCLCGSIPQGVEKSVYKTLIGRAHADGKIVALDCDGPAFCLGMEAKPDVIKPNLYELTGYLESTGKHCSFSTDVEKLRDEVADACGKLRENSGTDILCTLGSRGAVAVTGSGSCFCPAAKVVMRGFSGAGDCFLAGYLAAKYGRGLSDREALLNATACAAAKVSLEGTLLPQPDLADEFAARLAEAWKNN